jgi:energy-coupling factor transporter ATP-binding protein EcfA2
MGGVDMIEGESPGYHAATMEALTSMSEATLQAKIVEPLLRLMGFQYVRNNSGPNERGKDLVAIKLDFGKPKLYAIQIKKLQASGKHTKSTAMTNVVTQLRQTMLEPVLDPMVNVERPPDRGVFITPYAIHRDALASAIEQVRDLERREITIIDGVILVDLVLNFMPDAVTELDPQLRYRVHSAKAADRIPESNVFGVRTDLSLDEIFVEISLVYGKTPFGLSTRKRMRAEGPRITVAPSKQLIRLRSLYRKWVRGAPKIWVPPRRRLSGKEMQQYVGLQGEIAEIDLEPLLEAIDSKLRSYSIELANLSRAQSQDTRDLNRTIAKGITLAKSVDNLVQLEMVRESWPEIIRSARASSAHRETALFTATIIASINHSVLITGEPGAGKTTLLRRLSQMIARASQAQLPLLVPLVRISEPTAKALIEECLFTLSNLGYGTDKIEFMEALEQGKFRLLFDGLDEAGSAAEELFALIKIFSKRYKRCPLILTCRDTLNLEPWSGALHLQLNSFTDAQLRSFIDRWFRAEPTARDKLNMWFNENPKMMMAARTPLIAALLCSLQHAEADMPTTEVELYEERFSLLLGKWERAKGIEPLSPRMRQRYWHLLMDLAISMHKQEKRMIKVNQAIEQARQLEVDKINAESMIMDCTYRGIFLRENADELSFGHLTYQEFLAARWLAYKNPVRLILGKIASPWWAKTLDFYASIHGDISEIIKEAVDSESRDAYRALVNLASRAPLTRRGILRELRAWMDPSRSRAH